MAALLDDCEALLEGSPEGREAKGPREGQTREEPSEEESGVVREATMEPPPPITETNANPNSNWRLP